MQPRDRRCRRRRRLEPAPQRPFTPRCLTERCLRLRRLVVAHPQQPTSFARRRRSGRCLFLRALRRRSFNRRSISRRRLRSHSRCFRARCKCPFRRLRPEGHGPFHFRPRSSGLRCRARFSCRLHRRCCPAPATCSRSSCGRHHLRPLLRAQCWRLHQRRRSSLPQAPLRSAESAQRAARGACAQPPPTVLRLALRTESSRELPAHRLGGHARGAQWRRLLPTQPSGALLRCSHCRICHRRHQLTSFRRRRHLRRHRSCSGQLRRFAPLFTPAGASRLLQAGCRPSRTSSPALRRRSRGRGGRLLSGRDEADCGRAWST